MHEKIPRFFNFTPPLISSTVHIHDLNGCCLDLPPDTIDTTRWVTMQSVILFKPCYFCSKLEKWFVLIFKYKSNSDTLSKVFIHWVFWGKVNDAICLHSRMYNIIAPSAPACRIWANKRSSSRAWSGGWTKGLWHLLWFCVIISDRGLHITWPKLLDQVFLNPMIPNKASSLLSH